MSLDKAEVEYVDIAPKLADWMEVLEQGDQTADEGGIVLSDAQTCLQKHIECNSSVPIRINSRLYDSKLIARIEIDRCKHAGEAIYTGRTAVRKQPFFVFLHFRSAPREII